MIGTSSSTSSDVCSAGSLRSEELIRIAIQAEIDLGNQDETTPNPKMQTLARTLFLAGRYDDSIFLHPTFLQSRRRLTDPPILLCV